MNNPNLGREIADLEAALAAKREQKKMADRAARNAALEAARAEENARIEEAKNRLAKEHGVPRNARFDKAWAIAWEHGHSCDLSEVEGYFNELVELIKPMNLPTLITFEAMPLIERTRLFRDWVKAQPPEMPVEFASTSRCALARFGQALTGSPTARGAGSYFTPSLGGEDIPTLTSQDACIAFKGVYGDGSFTYGQLAQRLDSILS